MNESILGAIIGGAIAILGSIIGFLVQNKFEMSKTKREYRKQAYINAVKWFSRFGTSDMDFLDDSYTVYEEARIGIFLYASKDVSILFERANRNNATPQDREKFKAQVQKEIGYN